MSTVLDSSALLALLLGEPGRDLVIAAIASDAAISSVNLAEVMTRLVRDGVTPATAGDTLRGLPVSVHVFDDALALETGALFAMIRPFGLSLGDRACLALARRQSTPVLTADRAWGGAGPLVGVTVKLIR